MHHLNRRDFLQLSTIAGAAALAPHWMGAQTNTATVPDHGHVVDRAPKAIKLYDNVYMLEVTGGNMALQTGSDGTLLIDASFAEAIPGILELIATLTQERAALLANTHWHPDHTGGNERLHAAGYTISAHENTRKRLSTGQKVVAMHSTYPPQPPAAWPTITFDHSMRLWQNGDKLDLVHFDPAHTDGDIYIHFNKANILHLGDIFSNGSYPIIDEASGGSINGMIVAIEKSLALADRDTRIIPGHGELANKKDLQAYCDMMSELHDTVAALKKSGASEAETLARKPAAKFDPIWGQGFIKADILVGCIYRTV